MKDRIWCIYRIYTSDERPEPDQRVIFYGWTESRAVVKAFFLQRSKKKYKAVYLDKEEIMDVYEEMPNQFQEMMLDFVKLRSVHHEGEFPFFCTLTELQETEIRIQRMFREASSLKDCTVETVRAYMHLHPKYLELLHFIGFRPPEVDQLFPSADEMDNLDGEAKTLAQIETAYTGGYEYPGGPPVPGRIPGLSGIDDVCKKIIYSLESFVMVLKEDL